MTREYPDRPVVGVGAVVYVTGAEAARLGVADAPDRGVVLIKRRYEPLAGQWSLPGGRLELGETLEAGLLSAGRKRFGPSANIEVRFDDSSGKILMRLKRTLMGHQVIVPITNGDLDLGPWEQIFYAEFDGQRRKRVIVKVMGDK